MDKLRNRKEFAAMIGISARTLVRKLNDVQIELPKGLLSPKDQLMIREAVGFTD